MDVNDAPCLEERVVWTFIASKHRTYKEIADTCNQVG